jgi:hypothetical protein
MTLRPLACSALALLALLPACKRDAAPDAAGSGLILPGSASDAMLPADRVTSQPPLDPRADRGTGSGAQEKASGAAAGATGAAEPVAEGTGAAD